MTTGHPTLRKSLIPAIDISRAMLYYRPKQPAKDWMLKTAIEEELRTHPAYGHKRLALALKRNKKAILRVMHIFGITPRRGHGKKRYKRGQKSDIYANLLLTTMPVYPGHIWVADFTEVSWKGRKVYIATVMDLYTRRIIGLSVLMTHHTVLVIEALWNALLNHPAPVIFHSDNGSEYESIAFRSILIDLGIVISRSAPGCPWENGYQESFYDKFKMDLGDPERFGSLGELVAAIYQTVHEYNTTRIHTALKMPPAQFAELHVGAMMKTTVDLVS